MSKQMVWCVVALFAAGQVSQAKDACPGVRWGGPNGQGLYMWYSPYCLPDTGATALWLPSTAVQQYCPKGHTPEWCVGGLGPKPSKVHPNLKVGYGVAGAGPARWNEPFSKFENPHTGQPLPGETQTFKAKFALENGDIIFANLVRIRIPNETILWDQEGSTEPAPYQLHAVSLVGGWQVATPPPGPQRNYKDAYLIEKPTPTNKIAKVALETTEGEAIIADVVMHMDYTPPAPPEPAAK